MTVEYLAQGPVEIARFARDLRILRSTALERAAGP